MATTKKRINISVSKEVEDALIGLAKRDQVPIATKAETLLQVALELEEDIVLGGSAETRLGKGGRIISHEDAWQ